MKAHRILIGAILIAFAPLLVGRFYAIGDMQTVHIPLEHFFQQEIRAGRLPAWNPDISWGFPVIASGQIGFFYPPLLLGRLLLPVWVYLPLILIGHLAATAIGMYVFLRRQTISKSGALIGALAFSLSAFFWQRLTQLNIVITAAWLPWQLVVAHTIAQQPKHKIKHISLFALVLGAPFLAGQFQIPLLTAAIASFYYIYNRGIQTARWRSSILTVLIAALAVIGIGSAQILPTLQLVHYSDRAGSNADTIAHANQHSYPLYHLPTLLFPRFYGSDNTYWGKRLELEYGFYIGTIPLILAIWGIWRANFKFKIHRQNSIFFLWLAPITFLLALGNLSPFRLIGVEPSLWFFTGPARWLLFTTFALSYFSALGFDSAQQHPKQFARTAKYIAIGTVAIVLGANIVLHIIPITRFIPTNNEFVLNKLTSLVTSARSSSLSLTSIYTWVSLVPIIALAWVSKHSDSRRLILAISATELIIYAITAVPTVPWKHILEPPAVLQALPTNIIARQARVISVHDGGDTGGYFTDPASRAPQGNEAVFQAIIAPTIHSVFGIAGVEWPASLTFPAQEDALEAVKQTEPVSEVAAEELNIGAVITADSPTQANVTALSAKPRAELINQTGGSVGSTTYSEPTPSHTTITTEATQPATLLIRDTSYPGWQATIDGQGTPISAEKPFFRSLPVPAGKHTIDLTYHPTLIYIGLGISCITSLILLILSRRPVASTKRS